MPFTKFAGTHRCTQPTTRPDGEPLVHGDEWRCDEQVPLHDNPSIPGTRPCNKEYRWINDQREGWLWMPINYR